MATTTNAYLPTLGTDLYRRGACLFSILLLAGLLPATAARGQQPRAEPKAEKLEPAPKPEAETPTMNGSSQTQSRVLPERFVRWLEEVEPLILNAEKRLFLSLREDYQRDAFIEQFWRVRDPHERTARNELKERWPERVANARSKWTSLNDDRSRMLLIHGEADGVIEVKCGAKRTPAEIWFYRNTDWLNESAVVVFLKSKPGSEARIWRPGESFSLDRRIVEARRCINGAQLEQVVGAIQANVSEYERQMRRLLVKPRPSSTEWVDTFRAYSTDMPADATPLDAELELIFPGRHQFRTAVQGLITLDAAQTSVAEFSGHRSHDFYLTGDILHDGSLFESFRYKYGLAEDSAPSTIPLGFLRFLRPGDYQLVVRLDDLNSDRVFRAERQITVPTVDERFDVPTFKDPATERLFAEATASIAAGDTGLRLIPPQDALLTGFTRFDTLVTGDQIEKVRFYLDDKPVMTKNRPPFNVQIDLGPYPDLRLLRAEGLDAAGAEVASDQLLVNSGGYRFVVKLREPRPGKTYTSSLQARVEVEIPEGRSLERLEIFFNENLVATLYQEPFVHPIVLPTAADVAYVRAVAYLPDGNSSEDLVFINAPDDYIDEVGVQFVELYTSVLDRNDRPIEGLARGDFNVLEDGKKQQIARFDKVEDLPIHVGILIDTSASMTGVLDDVRRAALSFFTQAITPKDRAAVITFNNFPNLAVELTNDPAALGSGLAGLSPAGKTALYDSVMFSLYYFAGVKGQRAILVLSDGKDEASRFDFADTLEYSRRAGITIYSIGLRLSESGARQKLNRLAEETGGSSFFIQDIEELAPVYAQIQRELRSQLLIAYQSTNTEDEDEFRRIEVEVDRPGATVKTLSGYYP